MDPYSELTKSDWGWHARNSGKNVSSAEDAHYTQLSLTSLYLASKKEAKDQR
jgi:hypothetical protein